MSIYEKLIIPKKLHHVIFWLFIGTLIFVLLEYILRLIGENDFIVTRVWLICGGIIGLPIAAVNTERSFQKFLKNLNKIIKFPIEDYATWLDEKTSDYLALSTWQGRVYVFVVYLIVIIFFSFILGWPYQEEISNVVLAIFATPSILIAAHGSYLIVSLVKLLSKISSYPVNTPFYLVKHPALMNLSKFYNRTSLITLLFYFWMVILFWLSPYGMSMQVIIFLGVLGFYPSAIFLWSLVQIHTIMQNAKQEHVIIINNEIQLCLREIQENATKENAEKLSKLLDVQQRIEQEKEWPINLESIFTLLITFVIPIANMFLTVLGET